MAKCMTIASACNFYLRKHHLPPTAHFISYYPLNPMRPFLGDEQARWLCMLYLARVRKYAMRIHLSSVSYLCPGGAGQTHAASHSLLPSFGRGSDATGTWCTPELFKAVEKGYNLLKMHEVWHFPEDQRRKGLFADYDNTWLKLKQKSAGWPSWSQTVEQKREYVLRYREREGIRLDIARLLKIPDARLRPS